MDFMSLLGGLGGGGGGAAAPAAPSGPVTFGNVTQGGTGVSKTVVAVIVGVSVLILGGVIFFALRRGK